MSASYLQNSINQSVYPEGGVRSAALISEFSEGGDSDIHTGFQHYHTTQGGWSESVGNTGQPGLVNNRKLANVSTFRSGRSYAQWALASSLVNGNVYTKTTAGIQILTADPSTDAVNWSLNNTTGPALFGTFILEHRIQLQGNQPALVTLLNDAIGPAVQIFGRSADGTTNPRAQLISQGTVNCSGLLVTNNLRPAGNTVIGSATLVAGTVTVPNTAVTAGSTILVQRTSASAATDGALSSQAGAGTFTITSNNALDVSVVTYIVINPVI